jgi:tetratricopeptide (TPR) repeat protein
MDTRRVIGIAALICLVSAYALSHARLGALRAEPPPETRRAQALAIDPTLLKVISGPFKGMTANYLNIKAAVFMGGAWEVTQEDREIVYMLLKQSLYLDPLFFQTGYYTQGLLAWRKGMHEKAIEILTYHAEQRYWDWEPMFYVGFNYFYYLQDYDSAARYMRLAAERPGAPPIAANLAARLAHRSGQTLTAIALLKTMVERTENEALQAQYAKRLEAHLAVYEIEQAIERFRKESGGPPETLEALVDSGTLAALPANPFGTHFIYEPDTGKVFFDEQR